jgi:hypothetical protein
VGGVLVYAEDCMGITSERCTRELVDVHDEALTD